MFQVNENNLLPIELEIKKDINEIYNIYKDHSDMVANFDREEIELDRTNPDIPAEIQRNPRLVKDFIQV